MKILVAVVLILGSSLVPLIAGAESDAELVEKVVRGSRWAGWATGIAGSARLEFTFARDARGRLQGWLESTTASPATGASPGPLRWVELKAGKLTFTTPVGADYELAFDERGHLVGSARFQRFLFQVDLAPSQ
jgi:hypothetical protein